MTDGLESEGKDEGVPVADDRQAASEMHSETESDVEMGNGEDRPESGNAVVGSRLAHKREASRGPVHVSGFGLFDDDSDLSELSDSD